MKYDVVIVGGGPAGSTTARECAALGLSSLVLDKAEFPRDKPCGGGVTVRTAGLLPFSIEPVVERVVSDVLFSYRQANSFERRSNRALVSMTRRIDFDAFLIEKALEAGVTFREKAVVREVSRAATGVEVRTEDDTFRGSVLVAADGANGSTAAMAGVAPKLWKQVAVEGDITPVDGVPNEWQTRFGLDIGSLSGGYGWMFPKSDHVNVGVGGWRYLGPTLRDHLAQLAEFYGFKSSDLSKIRGHHLTIRKPDSPLVDGNTLLVGDAAGLVDPMTDEGIYSAVLSGGVAAKHIARYVASEAPDLTGYKREMAVTLLPELNVSRRFHDLFHLTPGLYLWAERHSSLFWSLAQRILWGDQTYVNVMLRHRVTGTAIDFISDLIRVAPLLQRKSGLRDPAPPQRFFMGDAARS
ncbi:MAG: NAD(P)/FAD-dependent oxidoreductase [SAR202 cluster bacterium]|jgi:geranylgeranyl reductase family protein|nr:NAD(P)/FAD-dependent oxidoreductase [SAR202 cluster bacterium]MDP6798878.1 NAD(P)/FAD-dependent oxidoreductase [SAR202 cluster bacterium]